MSREELENSIARDDFHHHGTLPNNFAQTLPAADQAYRAISTFKDEYLLDFINVEELGMVTFIKHCSIRYHCFHIEKKHIEDSVQTSARLSLLIP